MRNPRWRIVIPVAVLLTVAAPGLRMVPGGETLPDPWLLLLLWAVPDRPGASWRFPLVLGLILGLLRSTVSAVPMSLCWAGFGAALVTRTVVGRSLSAESALLRFLVGVSCALPPTVLDAIHAVRIGLDPAWPTSGLRIVWVGVFWTLVARPARWRFQQRSVRR